MDLYNASKYCVRILSNILAAKSDGAASSVAVIAFPADGFCELSTATLLVGFVSVCTAGGLVGSTVGATGTVSKSEGSSPGVVGSDLGFFRTSD